MFRPLTTIRREGWFYLLIVVIVLGGAMLKEVNLLLILAGMLLGPVLLNWQAVKVNLRGLSIVRKLPPTLCAGDVLSVGVHLTNLRRRMGCWAVVVEEQIQRIGGGNHESSRRAQAIRPAVFFPCVPAAQTRKGAYRGQLVQRGRYQIGPLRLSTQFPFGLFSRTITVGQAETVLVLPRLGRLTHSWAARRRAAFAGADRRDRRPGPEGDFYGVREWRGGDGQRLVHWRSSARLGKLVVRQLEQPRNRDVTVVLDLWQPERPMDRHVENVELAVSFAATVLADLCRKGGSNVHLAVHNAAPECFGGPASAMLLQGLIERLATVESRLDDCLPALLEHAMRRVAAGAEFVLVSTRPNDLFDTARFAALGSDPVLRDRARHVRCVDTSSEELAEYFQTE
jgi:uncharacterized protein (DUF58 family)